MTNQQTIKKLFLLISLPLVVWLHHNQITNWHYHINESGQIIKHAHPYSNSASSGAFPIQQHSHTALEYLYLALIAVSTSLTILAILFTILRGGRAKLLKRWYHQVRYCELHINTSPLRGPPFIIEPN